MCQQSDSANAVQRAADCLSQACIANLPEPLKTLRQIYSEPLDEEIPEPIKRLLDRLS